MGDYFGYKVALNCNDKNDRVSYKFVKNETAIYDKSYFLIYSIEDEKKQVDLIFKENISEKDFQLLQEKSESKALSEILFFKNKDSLKQAVGPVTFIWESE